MPARPAVLAPSTVASAQDPQNPSPTLSPPDPLSDRLSDPPPEPRAAGPHLRLLPPPPALDPAEIVGRVRRRPGPGQQPLALEFTPARDLVGEPALPTRLALVGDEEFGRRPTPRHALPPAGMWVARLATAVVESMLGQRPSSQLVRWTTHEVLSGLQRRADARRRHPSAAAGPGASAGAPTNVRTLGAGRQPRYTVRSMRLEEPADGIVEATVLLTGPGRPIPLAMRLEGLDGRWICTVVDTPDARVTGLAPSFAQRCYEDGA